MGWPMSISCMLLLWFAEKMPARNTHIAREEDYLAPFLLRARGWSRVFTAASFQMHCTSCQLFFQLKSIFPSNCATCLFRGRITTDGALLLGESFLTSWCFTASCNTWEKKQKHKVRSIFSILVTHNVLGEIQLVITKTDSSFLVLDTKQCCRWPFFCRSLFSYVLFTYLFRHIFTDSGSLEFACSILFSQQ